MKINFIEKNLRDIRRDDDITLRIDGKKGVSLAIAAPELIDFAKNHKSHYSLLFDSKEKLYYISGETVQQ